MARLPDHAALAALPPLPLTFFRRSALELAPKLLGKGLVVGAGRQSLIVEIVEVEAYMGSADAASHSYSGPTKRNHSMFEGGGITYVYLSYGMHHCMNVVSGKPGVGEGVLLRAAAPLAGLPRMAANRGLALEALSVSAARKILNGPGKLTQALGVGLTHDGLRLDQRDFKLVDWGQRYAAKDIGVSPRVGITKNADAPWRFFVKNSEWVSR